MQKATRIARYAAWSATAAALIFCLGSLQAFARGLDRITRSLDIDKVPEASLVFDRDGNLIFSFASEDRTNVRLQEVSSAMVSAVIAAEDRYFYRHAGMDVVGLLRAAWVDLRAQAVKQGGSTITQQLVRQVALSPERHFARKIKEVLLSLRIERRFQKDQILEAYLNRIYLGNGHYGVQAAARGYFGKTASELTVAESALLAGLIPCPSVCSPRTALEVAKNRRNSVLKAMHEDGAITAESYKEAIATPISLAPERHDSLAVTHQLASGHGDASGSSCGLHFIEAVRRQVMQRFGASEVLKGGLRIYTTVDMALQKHAEESIAKRLARIDKTGRLEGALVALDPRTGEVLALVGGRDFHVSSFNRATQAQRQPGSAFKPLLFAAAIEQGYTPSSVVTDMDTPISTPQGDWLPAGEHEAESYTLRQALTVSSNRAAVRVMQLIGVTTAQSYARRLGISSSLPAVPSLALGTGEVTLLDLTSAYGAFANSGIVAPHTLVRRVEDRNGNPIWQSSFERQPYRAIRQGTAYLMSSMLADVVNRGTGNRARTEGFKLPAAGKTGTTDDYADAWFIGYTPTIVTGVWFGHDEKKKIMNRGFASTVAVPAWADFMRKATEGQKPKWLDAPSDVERVAVCRLSGKRASSSCRFAYSEDGSAPVYNDYFLSGTGPYETCSGVHTAYPGGFDLISNSAAPVGSTKALSAVF